MLPDSVSEISNINFVEKIKLSWKSLQRCEKTAKKLGT